ncbi:hypothetical protein HETIRDRAFT_100823 [Heterobasidion irregulare TC 32-1]|uniref:Uncharacterized protein n=1 Tax=Heterobasidion irregulare (strain TC 32-1) TaxID=747525 RepID=W4KI62_HETIT|nr:uncharacterized protein HETIRDRAFT_100823 [Heterobasidion irregulare TC 32-1]ETW85532.1 hypothetical protein HETIRDRAFT_100823 [Heterobasidion irregulare TC 32-1]
MSFARRCQQVLWGFSLMSALINVVAIPLGAQRPSATNPRKTEWQVCWPLAVWEIVFWLAMNSSTLASVIADYALDIQYNNWKPMTIAMVFVGCLAHGHVFSPPSGGLTDPPPTTQLFPAWLAGSPLDVHSIFEEKPEITEKVVEEDAALRTDAKGAELP